MSNLAALAFSAWRNARVLRGLDTGVLSTAEDTLKIMADKVPNEHIKNVASQALFPLPSKSKAPVISIE